MEPVIVIVADHILCALDHEMGIMAKPEDIQHNRVPEVHNGPQQEAHPKGPEKSRASVHIPQNQTEDDDEQDACTELGRQLVFLRGDLVLVHVFIRSSNDLLLGKSSSTTFANIR